MAAWRWWQFNLTGERGELPELVTAAGGTWNFFPLLGVQPALGRTFTESEDRPDGNFVLLTWRSFERRFAGDPRLSAGKSISTASLIRSSASSEVVYLSRRERAGLGSLSVRVSPGDLTTSRFPPQPCDRPIEAGVSLASAIEPGGGSAVP